MNQEHEELAALYVLDRLNAAERARFESLMMRDADLARHVRELEGGYAAAIRALPPTSPEPTSAMPLRCYSWRRC